MISKFCVGIIDSTVSFEIDFYFVGSNLRKICFLDVFVKILVPFVLDYPSINFQIVNNNYIIFENFVEIIFC